MIPAIIISSVISAVLLLITILYDGGLRKTQNQLTFKEQLNTLNNWGKAVVIIILLLAIADPTISIINNHNTNEDYKRDTIRLTDFIKELKEQKKSDRLQISYLTELSKCNLDKTDSINKNIIQVAADDSRRYLDAIEKNKQNIYLHYKSELLYNYTALLDSYDSTNLWGFIDKTSIPSKFFQYKYMIEISNLTNRFSTVQNLESISELMRLVNDYQNYSQGTTGKTKQKNFEAILRSIRQMKPYLALEYLTISKNENFNEYETKRNITSFFQYQIDSLDHSLIKQFNLKQH
jgi:hypothetical protein